MIVSVLTFILSNGWKTSHILFFLLLGLGGWAQNSTVKWHDLSNELPHGRSRLETKNPFQRLPDSMEASVREKVWDLSLNPAGVNFRFATKAKNILVKYQIEGEKAFPHMPATGVSGVDLYKMNEAGDWEWVKGNFYFGDTITYKFQVSNQEENLNDYMLYLPLYTTLNWMKVGIIHQDIFFREPLPKKKPILIYGTSIAQGACASRPGNAWANILARVTKKPVLNFGFSGNGELEPEIVNYIGQLDVQAYILDCLPNFVAPELDSKDAYLRLLQSVRTIRKFHPQTPIILTDHAGYPDGEVNIPRKEIYLQLNEANSRAYKKLLEEGVKNIHLLSYGDIGLKAEDFVDGVHPTDGGMGKYAKAYEELLSRVLN